MIIDFQNNKLLVSFPYSPDIVQKIKFIDGHKWNKEIKKWEFPEFSLLRLIETFHLTEANFTPEASPICQKIQQLQKARSNLVQNILPDISIDSNLPLYAYQKEVIKAISMFDSFGIFLDMGLGKTAIAILSTDYKFLQKKIKKVIILCPKSVLWNWEEEINKFSTLSPVIYLAYPPDKRSSQIEKYLNNPDYSWLIMNYDGLLSSNLDWENKDYMLIMDESTRIKNVKAQRSKISLKIAEKTPHKLILTGAPITNSLLDIYSQWKIIDNGEAFGSSYYRFRDTFFTSDHKGWNWYPKSGTNQYISQILQKQSISKVNHNLDLPPQVYEKRYCELTGEQKEVYNDIVREGYHKFEKDTVSAQLAVTEIIKLMQITSGFVKTIETHIKNLDCPKIDLLWEMIEDINPDKNKIVIWCHFIYTIKKLEKLLAQYKPVTLFSETKNPQENIDTFQKDDSCRIFIGNPRAGGLGINLTAANKVIYFENSYSVEERTQSEKRTHRIGTKGTVLYIDLLTKETIDTTVLSAVKRKINIAEKVTRQNWGNIAYGGEK